MSEQWVLLREAANDLEAKIISDFLHDQGIPARLMDSSPYTGAMRIIGGMSPEVEIYVPQAFIEQARGLLIDIEEGE